MFFCSKDVRLPVQLQRAMAAEAEAAREARAKVKLPGRPEEQRYKSCQRGQSQGKAASEARAKVRLPGRPEEQRYKSCQGGHSQGKAVREARAKVRLPGCQSS
jgi:hypothetical protein